MMGLGEPAMETLLCREATLAHVDLPEHRGQRSLCLFGLLHGRGTGQDAELASCGHSTVERAVSGQWHSSSRHAGLLS